MKNIRISHIVFRLLIASLFPTLVLKAREEPAPRPPARLLRTAPDVLPAALSWLSQHQDAEGYWGSGESHALLTSVSLLAFLLQGETPLSWEHGLTVSKGLRALIRETSPEAIHPPERRALIVWCLSEAYGLTRIPIVLESLKTQSALLEFKSPTQWHSLAVDSMITSGGNPDLARLAIPRIIEAWANQPPDLATQAALFLLAHRQRNHADQERHLEAIRRLDPTNWKKHPSPLLTAILLSHALLRAGGKDWTQWSEYFFPLLARSQVRKGNLGWWTAESLDIEPPDSRLISADERNLFVTACLLLTYPPPRTPSSAF